MRDGPMADPKRLSQPNHSLPYLNREENPRPIGPKPIHSTEEPGDQIEFELFLAKINPNQIDSPCLRGQSSSKRTQDGQ